MEVVLLILKIIGIVLLSIVGIAVLLILLMLLWPFSYRIKGYKQEKDFDVAVRILWLLGMVTATVNYNKEAWLKVRLLGIPIYKLKIWPTEEKTKSEESISEEKMSDETTEASAENIQSDNDAKDNEFFDDGYEESEMFSDEDINREIEEQWNDDTQEDAFDKMPFLKKIKAFIEKIKELILKCRQKCYNIKDTIVEFANKAKKKYKEAKYYIKLIQHPCIQPALKKVWKSVKKLLKHVRPRRLKANIEFGSGDPASTMKIYGYYCMIYPFYGKKVKFLPDMENKVLNLNATLSGRVQMIQMLFFGWKLFADRNFRKLVRLIMREVKRRGRK